MNNDLEKINETIMNLVQNLDWDNLQTIEDKILEILNYDQRFLDNIEITQVKIKSKKKPKNFRGIYVGQVFEIYLEEISKFSYGIVIAGNIQENKYDDILIAYLNIYPDSPLKVSEITKHIDKRNFIMIANSNIYSIIKYEWPLVFTYEKKVFSQYELEKIPYCSFFMGGYYKSIGNSTQEIYDCEKIEEKEARQIMNPLGIIGNLAIIDRLVELYQKK